MEQEQNAQMTPELYTEEQLDAVETHITRWFGNIPRCCTRCSHRIFTWISASFRRLRNETG